MVSRRRVAYFAIALAFVGYGVSGGCFAQKLPPAVGAAEMPRETLPYDVVVAAWDTTKRHQNPEVYRQAAFTALSGSGAFRSVRLGAATDTAADFIAVSQGSYCNRAIIPILSIVSLGIIPTVFTDHDCDGIVLRPARATSTDSVIVMFDEQVPTVMGWLAVPIGWLPGWKHGEAKASARAQMQRRLAVERKRAELASLVAPR